MNKELDIEILRYNVPFVDDEENIDEVTLDCIAKHFYKYALNVVKKEAERLKECVGIASSDLCAFTDTMKGELNAYQDMIDFVESRIEELE